ncbi:nucleotidyltransferase domain-containing protein, partial [Patescibacteria group bacterium]|nr:nucleotidyltransferase domain-containing protein [Patescibacteria group bacterium]
MMSQKSDQQFTELLETAKKDPNIIGFFLGGSRGKGFENELSDYDPRMVVNDKIADEYKKKYEA